MKKPVSALLAVLVLVAFFVVCLVSALQLLAPRDMPFGVTGTSPVVAAVQEEYSLDLITYGSQAELTEAAANGEIYGGYVPGQDSDTLVTVPAKSFFGEVYVSGGFAEAAKKVGRTYTTTVVAPLPQSDRTGALIGLLLLPTLIGGYLIASMMFPFAATASAWRRIAVVLGFAVVVAGITAIAGRLIGAIPAESGWTLFPCFALVTAAVGLASIGIQAVLGKAGTLVVVVAFIVVGGAGAGGGGSALLPTYWQYIGALLPPRYAVDLYRNVHYFGGHNVAMPIAVLVLYAVAGVALVLLMDRRLRGGSSVPADVPPANDGAGRTRFVPKNLVAPVTIALIMSAFFAFNYMSSGHEPVADNMPFGVVGSSELPSLHKATCSPSRSSSTPTSSPRPTPSTEGRSTGPSTQRRRLPSWWSSRRSATSLPSTSRPTSRRQPQPRASNSPSSPTRRPRWRPRIRSHSSWQRCWFPCSSAATWPRRS